MNLKFTLIIAGLFVGSVGYGQEIARGIVYEDTNLNGKKDAKEKGVAQVAISNGVDVVLTDASGRYTIPERDNSIFFVIKPNGYQFPVDENNKPKFYYIHKPAGSPNLKYEGSKPRSEEHTSELQSRE